MRDLALEDFSNVMLVGPPKLRYDGEFIAFPVGKADLDQDKYVYRIWGVKRGKEPFPLTEGPNDSSVDWEPDGQRFLFIRKSEDRKQLAVWHPNGKVHVVMEHKRIKSARWASKNLAIALIGEGKDEEDVKRVREVPFWSDGEGWTYHVTNRLYAIDLKTGESWPITDEKLHVRDFDVSPDGKLAFLAIKDRKRPLNVSLFVGELDGEFRELQDSWYLVMVSWRGDSEALGVVGHDRSRGIATNHHLYETPINEWNPRDLVMLDYSVTNRLNSDVRGGKDLKPRWEGGRWYLVLHTGMEVHLYRTGDEGLKRITEGELSVEGFDIRSGVIAASIMTSDRPAEIFLVSEGMKRVTSFNDGFLSRVRIRKPERFSFEASDGVKVEGLIYKPDNPKGAVLYVHGGPATAFGHAFMHELHLLAKKYVVVAVNMRGSEGYGEEFRDIRGRYGERDFQDLMEAIDSISWLPENLAVMGGSYGGFMTNWIITHSDRFKAAVTMRGISNWLSMYGTTDIGFYFVEDQIEGTPWDNFDSYWEKSPLAHISNVKTPTLIIHSLNDYRCWLDQALQLFTALKLMGVETEMILFPDEGHDLSRSGKPKHRVERLKAILDWLERHLEVEGGESNNS